MNENEIATVLARLQALPGTHDDRHLARQVLQRDRRRVGLLTGLAVLFWVIAGAGIGFVVYVAVFHVYPKQQKLMHDQAIGKVPADRVIEIQASHIHAVELCTLVVAAAFVSATLAASCTLLLIFVSRRATLRQINANLVEIFEQLQQQRPGPAHAAPGSDPTRKP